MTGKWANEIFCHVKKISIIPFKQVTCLQSLFTSPPIPLTTKQTHMSSVSIAEIPFNKEPISPHGKRAPRNGITIKYTPTLADARFKERLSSSAPARTSFGLYPDTLSSRNFLLRKRDVSCSGEPSWVTDQRFKFRLEESFVESYANVPPGFGWGALSQVVYKTKYSRPVDGEQRGEEWIDTVRRVVEGIWSIQWRWCVKSNIKFNARKGQRMAQEAFDLIYSCKILPPGRVLWAVGSDIIEKKGLGAALQNILLAAGDFGLVGYLKGAPLFCADAIRTALDLPDGWEPTFLVLLGYPQPGFEPDTRPAIQITDFMIDR